MAKLVNYEDRDGKISKRLLPDNVPDSEAEKGIPVSVSFSELYPEPFASQLLAKLWERGIITKQDFEQNGVRTEIRKVIQTIIRMDTNDIISHALKEFKS